ncbi:TrkH family potassium uptake protein [Sandaracinobacter sp. RS1-74]|uniref:TrkH family potassium uptake protein n=1 Tax=Sandaracinobacteroides sayramensis TaxID=2913411 RepID=UPI001EDB2B26|nr:potassium transporter TrkG [Sandaracinobacteroides sayramensis]MCG2839611.1 TrkH family potassium uptake protein [Sandaracinobacteroides sayramensis]
MNRTQRRGQVGRRRIGHPERVVPLAFLAGIAAGTLLLMLPLARSGGLSGTEGAPLLTALFTATSALCVTGLTPVDIASYWSPFGHLVILLLLQAGGLGIMTGATLLGLLVTRRMPLRGRLMASAEMRSLDLGDVQHVLRLVVISTLATEAVLTLWLGLRFWSWGMPAGEALWHGLFHACSAFMNTGFSTLPEGLVPHRGDFLLLLPLMIGVMLGGIGFPVLHELRLEWRRPERWSIHTKLTLWGSVGLTLFGLLAVLLFEWANPATLGGEGVGGKLLGALFHSVMTRSGGFSIHDPASMGVDTTLISSALMLIGGGSASTAGGIRITTFLLLGFVVWSEIRARPDSVAFRRRISPDVQRQALAVVLTAVGVVSLGLLILTNIVEAPVEKIMFEAISAFATVGLSTGLTASMPPAGQVVLIVLMFVGRVGTVSLATALALRVKSTPFRYPEERPIVG